MKLVKTIKNAHSFYIKISLTVDYGVKCKIKSEIN